MANSDDKMTNAEQLNLQRLLNYYNEPICPLNNEIGFAAKAGVFGTIDHLILIVDLLHYPSSVQKHYSLDS